MKKLEDDLKDLQGRLKQGSDHDAEDHKKIQSLQNSLKEARDERDQLRILLEKVVPDLEAAKARLKAQVKKIRDLEGKNGVLETTLALQQKRNHELTEENTRLAGLNGDLENSVKTLNITIGSLNSQLTGKEDTLKRLKVTNGNLTEAKNSAITERNLSQKLLLDEVELKHKLEKQLDEANDNYSAAEDKVDIFKNILNKNGLSHLIPA